MPFDIPQGMTATVSALVHDFSLQPNNVISVNDPFSVHVEWSVSGPATQLLGGEWYVECYAESIGPGPERRIGFQVPAPIPAVPQSGHTYVAHLQVPAQAGVPGGLTEGPYKLVVLVNHRTGLGDTSLAGYVEGPIIRMRQP